MVEHIIVPKPDYMDTLSHEIHCSDIIHLLVLGICMLAPVYLNGKVCFIAIEVNNVFVNRVLTTKFKTRELSGSQFLP